ncbi:MAG: hypothetical protein O7E57_02245 [Gammaproteobacteria bacterium]|nr:hypothetical protein [Gammaproteobacteria bacterium]
MNNSPDKSSWEEKINALLDGELNEEQAKSLWAAAERDSALDGAINEAVELHRVVAKLQFNDMPRSLGRKLRQIPRQTSAHERSGFLQLRWGMVAATVLVALMITVSQVGPGEPSEAEIAQGRRDFNLTLTYLARASSRTSSQIASNIGRGFSAPVTRHTVRVISDQFKLNRE